MYKNKHMGTIACLVSAPTTGLKTVDEVRAALG
jgi:hypothetical protein